KIRSSAKIVIAGAGAAGLTIASQLAARLEPSAQIILIDSRIAHYYQPGVLRSWPLALNLNTMLFHKLRNIYLTM
ncbi:hypothetical protein AAUPMC_15430, partial [Pasteurella multocida subsp. multocida str. Anand1_cattle]